MLYHQWEHYRQLENDPNYLAMFLVDVRMEELSAYMPRTLEPVEVVATPQEPWSQKQWDIVDQLRCEVAYLHRILVDQAKQVSEPKKEKAKVLKGIEV